MYKINIYSSILCKINQIKPIWRITVVFNREIMLKNLSFNFYDYSSEYRWKQVKVIFLKQNLSLVLIAKILQNNYCVRINTKNFYLFKLKI